MKQLLLIILLIHSIKCLQAQSLNSSGMDSVLVLNSTEASFLNKEFSQWQEKFEFTNKKIAFVTGSTGKRILSKQAFFTQEKIGKENHSLVQKGLVIFSPEEKEASGGYDGIVLAWVKYFSEKQKGRIIKELKNAH